MTYVYDAKGRLVGVSRSGTVNNGVAATYSYDPSDNRTAVTVTGAGSSAPAFAIGDGSGSEGGSLSFTVTRSGDLSASQSVNWASASNTAISETDFSAGSGTLTFAAGEPSKTVSIATLQDTVYEGNETLFVNLSGVTGGATISDPQGLGTITDDDQAITFAIGDVSVVEGGNLVLTVTKTGTTVNTTSVNYASANGNALAGSDYTAVSGTLTFLGADTSKTVTIATIDDGIIEANETVLVNLSGASVGTTISDGQGVGTITDNDAPASPTLSVSDGGNTEGFPITFTVTRSGDTSFSVSVSYATATGTAGSNDFTAASGTLTFAAGQTSKTVTVQTSNNNIFEEEETFTLNLSNPTGGATISDGEGIGTIFDDDSSEPCPTCRTTSTPEDSTTEEVPPADPPGGGL